METLIQDIRYGFRTLLKTPGFTLIAVLSLALGIGANTAIFSIIDSLMLKELPVREPERLASIGKGNWRGIFGGLAARQLQLISVPEWQAIRQQKNIIVDACGVFSLNGDYRAFVGGNSSNEPFKANAVTGNYFNVLGVQPFIGRVFTDAVDQPLGAHPELVLSYGYWKRRFGGNPDALGQTLRIADRLYTVVGVAAPEFFGTTVGESPDAWVPFSMLKQLPPFFDIHENLDHALHVFVRLQPGVSLQQASTANTQLIRRLLRSYIGASPSKRELHEIALTSADLVPAANGISGLRNQFSRPLQVLMVVVGLVLLIACANVANLLLARATAREREMSIRLAIGSSRLRAMRQLLTESLLLSATGGLFGILLAMWGSHLLVTLVSTGTDRVALDVTPNLHILGFTLAVSMLTGILFGMAPAFRASSVDVNHGLREGRSGTASRSRMFAGRALVVFQVALSLLLLVGAGLFIRNFRNLENIDTGFKRDRVLVVSLETESAGYKPDERLVSLYQRLESRVKQIPGVAASALTMFVFNQGSMDLNIGVEGHPDVVANNKSSIINVTGPGYLETTRIPLLHGRYFNAQDTAKSPKVAVINEKLAHDVFGSASPIGRHIAIGETAKGQDIEIVGVARTAKYVSLREEPGWATYVPYTQRVEFLGNFLVRVQGNPAPVIFQIRAAIPEIDRNLPIREITTLGDLVDRSINIQHLIAQLSGFFGALALLLASLGLYGILTYSVVRRTPEIGVRMALGAQDLHVLWMILRESLTLIGIGILIGIPVAWFASSYIESLLFEIKPNDAVTLAIAALVLAVIGGFAGLLPARRAAHVDPMVALRYE